MLMMALYLVVEEDRMRNPLVMWEASEIHRSEGRGGLLLQPTGAPPHHVPGIGRSMADVDAWEQASWSSVDCPELGA